MAKANCPRCGGSIEDAGRKFCPSCGAPVDESLKLMMNVDDMVKEYKRGPAERTQIKSRTNSESENTSKYNRNYEKDEEIYIAAVSTEEKSYTGIIVAVLFVIVACAVYFIFLR